MLHKVTYLAKKHLVNLLINQRQQDKTFIGKIPTYEYQWYALFEYDVKMKP